MTPAGDPATHDAAFLFWLFITACFALGATNPTPLQAAEYPPHHKRTIAAIDKCMSRTKQAIEQGAAKRPNIACNIPFAFKEAELDKLLTQSGSRSPSDTAEDIANEKRLNAASKTTVKSLINVRSAKCLAKIRVKTRLVEKAIAMKNGEMTLPAQPVTCDLKTKANKVEKVRFTFKPTGTFEGNCLREFSPAMGNFNIDCTFCRLNFVAKTLAFWVNRLGSQFRVGINRAIGKTCRD